jgi:hypothetical protein
MEDYYLLYCNDPAAAKAQRELINIRLNANLANEGITPTPPEMEVQRSFAAGEMDIDAMLKHMQRYIASIAARYGSR